MPSFVHKILSDKIKQVNAALPLSETLEEIQKLLAHGNLLGASGGKQFMSSSDAKNEDAVAPLISSAVSKLTSLEELVQLFSDPQIETQDFHDEQGQLVGTVTRQNLLEAMLLEVKQAKQPQSDSSELPARDIAKSDWSAQLFKEAPIGLGFVDTQFRYVEVNDWLANLNERSVEEHLGRSIGELFPEWAPIVEAKLRQVLETGEPILEETSSLGTPLQRYFHYSYMPVKSDDGTVLGVSCAIKEITEQKKAEHALKDAHDELDSLVQQRTTELQVAIQKLQTEIVDRKQAEDQIIKMNLALSHAMPGISRLDTTGCYVEVNEHYANALGYEPSDLIGNQWSPTVHPEDIPIAADAYEAMCRDGKSEFEARAVRKDGSLFYKHVYMVKINNAKGAMIGHHCFMRDISERKLIEEELRSKNNLLTSVLEGTTDAVFLKDLEGRYLVVNQATSRVFGIPSDEAIGKDDTLLFPADAARNIQDIDSRVISSGNPITLEEELRSNDFNSPRIFLTTKAPYRNHEGQILGVIGIARDITERKQAEEALHNSEARIRTLLEGSPVCTQIIDLDFKLQYMSSAGINLLKISDIEPFYGGPFPSKMYPEEWRQPVIDHLERAKAGETCRMECIVHDTEGSDIWFDTTFVPVQDEAGTVQHLIVTSVNITERKLAEQALLDRTARYELIAAGAADAVWDWDIVNHTVYYSPRWKELRGYPPGDISDSEDEWSSGIHPEDAPRVMTAVQTHFEGKTEFFEEEYRICCKDGTYKWVHDRGIAQRDETGTAVRMAGSESNISERKLIEEELIAKNNLLTSVLAGTTDPVFVKDLQSRYLIVNPAAAKVFGITAEEAIGKTDYELFPAEAAQAMVDFDQSVIESGISSTAEEELLSSEFENPRTFLTTKDVYLDHEGAIEGIVGISHDITERKLAEQATREKQLQLDDLLSNVNAIILEGDPFTFNYVGGQVEKILGYPKEMWDEHPDGPGGFWFELLHPDDLDKPKFCRQSIERGEDHSFEYRLIAKDGKTVWFYDTVMVETCDGNPVKTRSVIVDITERKKFEHALQRLVDTSSRKSGKSLFESLALELADVLQADYTFIGKFPDEGKEYVRTIAAVANGKRVPNFEYYIADTPNEKCVGVNVCSIRSNVTHQYPSDVLLQEIDVEGYVGVSLHGASGELMGIMAALYRSPIENTDFVESILQVFSARVGSEIERQQAELQSRQLRDELSHMGRIATMGELGTGLAHELNQPLAAIANYCFVGQTVLTQTSQKETHKLKEVFDKMEQQAIRASSIIKRLREHVQKTPSIHAAVPIGDVVQDVIELMSSELKLQEIQLEINIDEPKQEVLIDSIQIQQVLLNLIKNAMEAMDEIENNDRSMIITKSPPIEGMIEIAVCDSGMGIPEDKLESVFEAFFTTKRTGMGMGLAICRSIIETHNGRLWATSNLDRGTTFHFTLPISKDQS